MSKPIVCDGIDITRFVAAMYDSIVESLDWGSNFLDDESVEAILLVGRLAGFEYARPSTVEAIKAGNAAWSDTSKSHEERAAAYKAANDAWQKQYQAKLDAKIAELKGEI